MTTIGMYYDVIPGKEQEFETGFAQTAAVMQTLKGHVESKLYEDVSSRGSYVILSQWETKEDFDAFIHSEAFKKAVAWGKARSSAGAASASVAAAGGAAQPASANIPARAREIPPKVHGRG